MAKTLSPKQRSWLKHYLDHTNKETFGNASASAKAAGYKCSNQTSFEAVGSQNARKLSPLIEEWLDENALSTTRLKELLAEGLQAFETKFFAHQGEVVTEREVIPWEIRRKYLEMALKIRGMFAPDKHEITGKNGGAIDLTTLVMEITHESSNSDKKADH